MVSGVLGSRFNNPQPAGAFHQIQAVLVTSSALIHSLQNAFASNLRGHANASVHILTGILDDRIRAIDLPQPSAENAESARLKASYRHLLSEWLNDVKPMLKAFFSSENQNVGLDNIARRQARIIEPPPRLMQALDTFESDLAQLGFMLRKRAASASRIFNVIHYASLLLLLAMAVLLRRTLATPGSKPVHDGNTGMAAADGKASHADLSRPNNPAHASASLALLQTVLAGFVDNPESPKSFLPLLREIERLIGAKCSAIFITKESDDYALPLVCTDPAERDCFVDLVRERLPASRLNGLEPIQTFIDPAYRDIHIIAVQLAASDGLTKSLLLVKRQFALRLSSAETALINRLGEHLTAIICSAQRARQNRRVALCEERAVIARELHDSLAQSLSYLKIQTGRLQSLLRSEKGERVFNHEDADAVLQELRTNLNLAYRQLRELITTFRLTMNGRSLNQALKDSIEEFENRSSVALTLDNRLSGGLLSVDEEMHVLQIVRECVCNIVRHAQARHAEVSLYKDGFGVVRITVDDDGIGMHEPSSPDLHHGLVIIQQRAHNLGGDMRVRSSPEGGTRIRVSFVPRKPN
jgi:two-component system, NarL family, nitrate/nitrite sensor histidine kinase NarX